MKICFFTENYYKGGLDTFLINLFNSWPEPGDQLFLVCNASHAGLETISAKAATTVSLTSYERLFTSKVAQGHGTSRMSRLLIVRAFFVLLERILQYPVLFPWYVLTLSLHFRRSAFDRLMVVNGGYPASLLCRAAVIAWALSGKKYKALLNFHNSLIDTPWYFRFAERLIDSALIRSCSHIVSVSNNCLRSLYGRQVFRGCEKLAFIYNGIEDPLTATAKETTSPSPDTAGRYCLMLATYEERKGHAFLLEAFKEVVKDFPDVQLQICGHGRPKERKRVGDLVKHFGLEGNVTLAEFVPNTTALIAQAALLVVPSQSFESFGLTIVEAMAIGTPVVATHVGGIPEVLADSSAGYVCPKNDAAAFAAAMKRILGDAALAAELGRNGRKTYESRYTAARMAEQYRSFLL